MGSASIALGSRFVVRAVDIQEYSRVVCSALLDNDQHASAQSRSFFSLVDNYRRVIETPYIKLMDYEERALASSDTVTDSTLASIIEGGCMLPEYNNRTNSSLEKLIDEALDSRDASLAANDAVVRYYGGTYYSYRQAVDLAAASMAAREYEGRDHDRFLAATICAASQCGSTVGGQFAQPLKTVDSNGHLKRQALNKARSCRQKDVLSSLHRSLNEIDERRLRTRGGEAVCQECSSFLAMSQGEADLIYADPPYSRYHYSRYYHVLETIARGDEPSLSINPATGKASRGIYRNDRYQSNYSKKSTAKAAFKALFKAAANAAPALMLSYSPFPGDRPTTPRMVTISDLTKLASEFYSSVEVKNIEGVKHSKLTNEENILDTSNVSEVLLICRS